MNGRKALIMFFCENYEWSYGWTSSFYQFISYLDTKGKIYEKSKIIGLTYNIKVHDKFWRSLGNFWIAKPIESGFPYGHYPRCKFRRISYLFSASKKPLALTIRKRATWIQTKPDEPWKPAVKSCKFLIFFNKILISFLELTKKTSLFLFFKTIF